MQTAQNSVTIESKRNWLEVIWLCYLCKDNYEYYLEIYRLHIFIITDTPPMSLQQSLNKILVIPINLIRYLRTLWLASSFKQDFEASSVQKSSVFRPWKCIWKCIYLTCIGATSQHHKIYYHLCLKQIRNPTHARMSLSITNTFRLQ